MPKPTTPPPPTLDYAKRPVRSVLVGDRIALFAIGLFVGTIGVAIALATLGICVKAWPSFGMTLIAVPVEAVAAALIAVGVASIRVAVASNAS